MVLKLNSSSSASASTEKVGGCILAAELLGLLQCKEAEFLGLADGTRNLRRWGQNVDLK